MAVSYQNVSVQSLLSSTCVYKILDVVSERPRQDLAKGKWCIQMIVGLNWTMQRMWKNCVENLHAECFCLPGHWKTPPLNPGFCQEHFSLGFILKQVLLINCITGALCWQPVPKLKRLSMKKIINQMQYNNIVEHSSIKSVEEGQRVLRKLWNPWKKGWVKNDPYRK